MQQQITFILKLRGVSALLVLFYHHCHFFWLNQDFCGRLAQQTPLTTIPGIARFLEALPINLGNLGVAVFFLISGFLMPLAARNKTRLEFLFRRFWRIWPTYVVALLLTMGVVYFSSKYNQQPFPLPWSIGHIAASLFLVRDIGGYPFIDGIVWTLEVELKFYLLCVLARSWLVDKPIRFTWLIMGLTLLAVVLMKFKGFIEINMIDRSIRIFFKTMKFICFIGLGCLVSYVYQKKIMVSKAFGYSLALAMVCLSYFIAAGNYAWQWKEAVSYGVAYLLFIGCYALREKFLNQGILADVGTRSYSLYLVHGVTGFIMMYWLMGLGLQVPVVIGVTTTSLLLGASMFYLLVETKLKDFCKCYFL